MDEGDDMDGKDSLQRKITTGNIVGNLAGQLQVSAGVLQQAYRGFCRTEWQYQSVSVGGLKGYEPLTPSRRVRSIKSFYGTGGNRGIGPAVEVDFGAVLDEARQEMVNSPEFFRHYRVRFSTTSRTRWATASRS